MTEYLHIQSIEPEGDSNRVNKDKRRATIWFDPDQNRDYEDLIS